MAQHPNARSEGHEAGLDAEAHRGGPGRPGLPAFGPAVALDLFLSGCATPESKEAEKTTPEGYCRSRGLAVGSTAYGDCVEHQKQLGVVRFFSRDQMIRPR